MVISLVGLCAAGQAAATLPVGTIAGDLLVSYNGFAGTVLVGGLSEQLLKYKFLSSGDLGLTVNTVTDYGVVLRNVQSLSYQAFLDTNAASVTNPQGPASNTVPVGGWMISTLHWNIVYESGAGNGSATVSIQPSGFSALYNSPSFNDPGGFNIADGFVAAIRTSGVNSEVWSWSGTADTGTTSARVTHVNVNPIPDATLLQCGIGI